MQLKLLTLMCNWWQIHDLFLYIVYAYLSHKNYHLSIFLISDIENIMFQCWVKIWSISWVLTLENIIILNDIAASKMQTKNLEKQILIFLPIVNQSNQLQSHAISKRFDIKEWGWSRLITNFMQFYVLFLFLKLDKYYRRYRLKRLVTNI